MMAISADSCKKHLAEVEIAIAPYLRSWDALQAINEYEASHPDTPTELIAALRTAVGYFYVEATDVGNRQRLGPWGPAMEMTDGRQVPPPLADIEPDMLAIWRWVLENTTSVFLRARMGDLCWCRRVQPRPDVAARSAIQAYLDLAVDMSDIPASIWHVNDLSRALEISREIRDESLCLAVETSLLEFADSALASENPAAGIILRALQPLASVCQPLAAERRDSLLDRAMSVLAGNPAAFESAVQLRARSVDDESRAALNRRVVEHWLTAANHATDGMLGLQHRQHALELAKAYGFRDLEDHIRVQIQSIDRTSLGIEWLPVNIQVEGLDQFIVAFVRDSYVSTLMRLASFGPPSGDLETNRRQIEEQRTTAPLQAILPRALMGPANSTIWHAPAGTPERDRFDIASHEKMRIMYCGRLFSGTLREATSRFGPPTEDDLTAALTSELIEPIVARPLAHGCHLIATGYIDDGVHVALPRVETVIRELARRAGQPITNDPRGETPGGVRTLGVLLNQLQGPLDDGWRRYLSNALCDPLGLNLRNRVLHGLVDGVHPDEAAVLLHCIAFLASLTISS